MSSAKKYINLPGQPFYRYDDTFKRKVLSDIQQGLISERKATKLYGFERSNIANWKKSLEPVGEVPPKVRKQSSVKSDSVVVASTLALNQEIKSLKEQLSHEKLRSEALQIIIEVAELDLLIPIRKKPLPQQ